MISKPINDTNILNSKQTQEINFVYSINTNNDTNSIIMEEVVVKIEIEE